MNNKTMNKRQFRPKSLNLETLLEKPTIHIPFMRKHAHNFGASATTTPTSSDYQRKNIKKNEETQILSSLFIPKRHIIFVEANIHTDLNSLLKKIRATLCKVYPDVDKLVHFHSDPFLYLSDEEKHKLFNGVPGKYVSIMDKLLDKAKANEAIAIGNGCIPIAVIPRSYSYFSQMKQHICAFSDTTNEHQLTHLPQRCCEHIVRFIILSSINIPDKSDMSTKWHEKLVDLSNMLKLSLQPINHPKESFIASEHFSEDRDSLDELISILSWFINCVKK